MKRALTFTLIVLGAIFLFLKFFASKESKAAANSGPGLTKEVLGQKGAPAGMESSRRRPKTAAKYPGIRERYLSTESLEAYLSKVKRSAEGLVNAYEEHGNTDYLNEAARLFPTNPLVQLTVLVSDLNNTNLTTEERDAWLNRMRSALPQNGLPDCLAAMTDLSSGQTQKGLDELAAAAQKPVVDPMSRERLLNREEMFLLSGLSSVEAREQAWLPMTLPLEGKMRTMTSELAELEKSNLAAGNVAVAAQIAALGVTITRSWGDPRNSVALITDLVANSMERTLVSELNPGTSYDFLGETAGERLAELEVQNEGIKVTAKAFDAIFPKLSENDKLAFFNKTRTMGELDAAHWLVQTYGKTTDQ